MATWAILKMVENFKRMEEIVMKKILCFLGGLMVLAFTACTGEDILEDNELNIPVQKVSVTAYAPDDNADSRIAFNQELYNNHGTPGLRFKLTWDDKESFSVIRNGENQTFEKNTKGNTFTGVLPDTDGSGKYYAVYPANPQATNAEAVPFDLTKQTGKFDSRNTYMSAESEDGTSFKFKHRTAVLMVTFKGLPTGVKIKHIAVQTAASVKTDGTINLNNGTITGGTSNGITIINDEGFDPSKPVYFYLPPMHADYKILRLMVAADDNRAYSAILQGSSKNAFEAGKFYNATVTLKEKNSLMFIADGEQKLLFIGKMDNLQYSINDDGNWKDLGTSWVYFGKGKVLFLRAKSKRGVGDGTNARGNFQFGYNDVKVACAGDIRTLVNYDAYKTADTKEATFKELFYKCTPLISAPALPATTLAAHCYDNMFYECTSLTAAPALPATVLEDNCYLRMFYGCTSLTKAPDLPATTLATHCYWNMFHGCTSLTATPALPATNLAYDCYAGMFYGCTSLTNASDLPATNLAEDCYYEMFYGCTSLTKAPTLHATILAPNCCKYMFGRCTSLTSGPALPATTLAENCYHGMFLGCTSLTTAPELAATTLAYGCYSNMFYGCTSLTKAPVLRAETLTNKCYEYMFYGCSALKEITMLGMKAIPAGYMDYSNCMYCWVGGVSSEGTFIKASNTNIHLPEGISGIPTGWTVKEE